MTTTQTLESNPCTCNYTIRIKDWNNRHSYKCNKPATHNGKCAPHARVNRIVIRVGDVGEILHRFDTIEQAIPVFNSINRQDIRIQKITNSRRRDLLFKEQPKNEAMESLKAQV